MKSVAHWLIAAVRPAGAHTEDATKLPLQLFVHFFSYLVKCQWKKACRGIFKSSRSVFCKNQENGAGKQWSLNAPGCYQISSLTASVPCASLFQTPVFQLNTRLVFPKELVSAQRFSSFHQLRYILPHKLLYRWHLHNHTRPDVLVLTARQKIESDATVLAAWARDHNETRYCILNIPGENTSSGPPFIAYTVSRVNFRRCLPGESIRILSMCQVQWQWQTLATPAENFFPWRYDFGLVLLAFFNWVKYGRRLGKPSRNVMEKFSWCNEC